MGWPPFRLMSEADTAQVLTAGPYDGLSALRLPVDSFGVPVAEHFSVEKEQPAWEVGEAYFPDSIFHDDIQIVDEEVIRGLALRFPSVGLALIGVGPLRQGVSGLSATKKGALHD